MLDTLHVVQTPEGVDLSLRVAGPVPRAYAWLIDSLLRGLLLIVILTFAIATGTRGLQWIAWFAVWWFYHVFFEVRGSGQTPGKRVMGLQVVRADGTPVGWTASMLRNLIRVLDFAPALYVAGLASMLIDSSFRRLGDLAAGTLVIYRDERAPEAPTLPAVAPLPPPVPLALDEQRAVIAFVERAPLLTAERAAELGAVASPLAGDDAQARLTRMAAWLVGGAERGQ